jgi:hypothetical protein
MRWPKKITVMNDLGVYSVLDDVAASYYARTKIREYVLVVKKSRRKVVGYYHDEETGRAEPIYQAKKKKRLSKVKSKPKGKR